MTDHKDEKNDDEMKYGGCEGPDAMYVKLVSSDGHEFIVKREHALTSGTIKAMLSGPGMYLLYNSVVRSLLINCQFNDIVRFCSVSTNACVCFMARRLFSVCSTGQFSENETNEINFREIP